MLAAMENPTAKGNGFVLCLTAKHACGRHIHPIILILLRPVILMLQNALPLHVFRGACGGK